MSFVFRDRGESISENDICEFFQWFAVPTPGFIGRGWEVAPRSAKFARRRTTFILP
jgi:hypothetical protein